MSVRILASVLQHAMRMRRFMLSSVVCLALPSFSTYLINSMIFGGWGGILNIKCLFRFSVQLVSETFLILRIIQLDIMYMYRFSCKMAIFLVRF